MAIAHRSSDTREMSPAMNQGPIRHCPQHHVFGFTPMASLISYSLLGLKKGDPARHETARTSTGCRRIQSAGRCRRNARRRRRWGRRRSRSARRTRSRSRRWRIRSDIATGKVKGPGLEGWLDSGRKIPHIVPISGTIYNLRIGVHFGESPRNVSVNLA